MLLPDKFAGAGFIILGDAKELNGILRQRIQIWERQLAGGTIGLKEHQQRQFAIGRNGKRRSDLALLQHAQSAYQKFLTAETQHDRATAKGTVAGYRLHNLHQLW